MLTRLFIALLAVPLAVIAKADTLYVPTVHILSTDGKYNTYAISGFEQGVALTECQMRVETWEKRFGPSLQAAQQTLANQGQFANVKTSCEPK